MVIMPGAAAKGMDEVLALAVCWAPVPEAEEADAAGVIAAVEETPFCCRR